MEYRYDAQADAIYISFNNKPYAYGIDLDEGRRIDYTAENTPIGAELLNVSEGVNLNSLPHVDEIAGVMKDKGIKMYELAQYSYAMSDGSNVVLEVTLDSPATREQDEQTIGLTQGVTA